MNRRGFLKASSVAAVAGLTCAVPASAKEQLKIKNVGQPNYLILSCDGGGMRGYLSSLILQKLSQDLNIFGNNNKGIDLYAGTSTGGLIALGLAAGKTIEEVVELYEDDGAAIFSPLSEQSPCVQALPSFLRKYKSVSDLYQVEYDDISNPSVSTVLQDFVPGNPILNTLPNKVMVTTLQLAAELSTGTSWNPLIIENLTKSAGASTHLWDAALSTSAAPIYFPPYKHPDFGWCSDGGLFANNPAPQAMALAIQSGVPLANIAVLSIGTGLANASMAVDASKRLCYGVNKWVSLEQNGPTPKLPLFNSVMDGVASTNDYLCAQMLGNHYLRINPPLGASVSMDDHSDATMQMYRDAASALFENEDQWEPIKTWIQQNFRR